ncbi:hypothetical protein ACQ0MK_11545 [Thalassospira lucentensis]|uniref:hypothetical protein n=1 Tax=Thalassospira lucentensis TaxID=168935 RepID=UPI003D2EC179
MGSLFSTPKPVATSKPVTASNSSSTETETSAEQAASNARKEALERRRYGRSSLIATSYRGLLNDRINQAVGGKNLLGD